MHKDRRYNRGMLCCGDPTENRTGNARRLMGHWFGSDGSGGIREGLNLVGTEKLR